MGKIAFVFAGQGAQYSGMGKTLYENNGAARQIFDDAEKLFPSLRKLCFEGSSTELAITANTQPALFAVDLACAEALRSEGIIPQASAGFSLGEVPAAAFCGIMSFQDAFAFVMKRASLMQECSERTAGGMVAVLKLSDEAVKDICSQIDGAYPVNFNAPGQVVVACLAENTNDVITAAKKAGGRAVKLRVSGAFHSPYMDDAAKNLREYLNNVHLSEPAIPLYANLTALPYSDENQSGKIADTLSAQVNNPVRWKETIENMASDGVDTFIEVGAGNVLSGLIKKILPEATVANCAEADDIEKIKELLR